MKFPVRSITVFHWIGYMPYESKPWTSQNVKHDYWPIRLHLAICNLHLATRWSVNGQSVGVTSAAETILHLSPKRHKWSARQINVWWHKGHLSAGTWSVLRDHSRASALFSSSSWRAMIDGVVKQSMFSAQSGQLYTLTNRWWSRHEESCPPLIRAL